MAVTSVFTYNGETAILKLHLSILNDYVDKFIIVEANKTFTGQEKPLYFFRDQRFFKQFWKKIDYYVVNEWDDPDLWAQATNSPNTVGASHWKREFYIKESIHKALRAFKVEDDDLLFIGDVDEIIDPTAQFESTTMVKARLRVYANYLNNASSERFYGPLIALYKDVKGECLNHLRSDPLLQSGEDYLGWHFTNMGGTDEIRRKLDSSYTAETYNTFEVQQLLPQRLKDNQDYLGRNFQFQIDETHWPEYLKLNKAKYKDLCK